MKFAAVHMAAIGTKRTSRPNRLMSAFGGKADIASTSACYPPFQIVSLNRYNAAPVRNA